MEWLRQNTRKTLLGQLLIGENLISESQLARAIEQQRKTGQRLGDVIAEWDLLSKKQMASVLRKQRNLRFIASILTALLGPIPAHVSAAAAPMAPVTIQTTTKTVQKQATVRKVETKETTEKTSQWDMAYFTQKGMGTTVDIRFPEDLVELAKQPLLDPKEAALRTVERHHSRVAGAIRNMWGYKECCDYINKLMMEGNDDRGRARMGFHQEAVDAMLVLIAIHEKQFPELTARDDVFFAKLPTFASLGSAG